MTRLAPSPPDAAPIAAATATTATEPLTVTTRAPADPVAAMPPTLLFLLSAFLSLQPVSTDFYLPSLPAIAQAFGAGPAAVQQTLTVFVLVFGLAQLVAGPVTDRFGRRPVALAGLALFVTGSLAGAGADDLQGLVIARVLQALGVCCTVVSARATVRDLYAPDAGARVMARAFAWMTVAIASGPPLGGLLQTAFGWRAAFLAMGGLGALVFAVALRGMRETNARPDPRALAPGPLIRTYRMVLASPVFRAFALTGGCSYAGLFAFIAGSSFVLIRTLGVSAQAFGLLFATTAIGYWSGTMLARRLIARRGLHRAMRPAALLALGAGLLMLAMATAGLRHPAAVVPPMVMYLVAHGILQPCSQAGAIGPFPRAAGAAAALMGAITLAGTVLQLGLTAASAAVAPQGHDGVLLLSLAVTIAGAGSTWLVFGPLRAQAEAAR